MNDLASGKDMLRAATNTPVLIVSSMWQCLRPKRIKKQPWSNEDVTATHLLRDQFLCKRPEKQQLTMRSLSIMQEGRAQRERRDTPRSPLISSVRVGGEFG